MTKKFEENLRRNLMMHASMLLESTAGCTLMYRLPGNRALIFLVQENPDYHPGNGESELEVVIEANNIIAADGCEVCEVCEYYCAAAGMTVKDIVNVAIDYINDVWEDI